MAEKKLGDFTGLAGNYARFRQGYSDSVLTAVLAVLGKDSSEIDAIDLGAGTGIWTRMLASRALRSVTAVEPNADMRGEGQSVSASQSIKWIAAPGEKSDLPNQCADLVTAASSFHWMDFEKTVGEIKRLLRPGGRFVALWNPRLTEASPLLSEIETHLSALVPSMKRISSGRSSFTEQLSDRLATVEGFDDLLFMEGRNLVRQPPDAYLGAWESVNDVQVQLGPDKWHAFLDFVEQRITGRPYIETVFLTRAWVVRNSP